tara:strand:- start:1166 stop:1396 length:231 start_codon:yes stop_codon:yes gene_type:complete
MLIITVTEADEIFDIGNNSKVFIFENVSEYQEEICDIIKSNKMNFSDIKFQVESWGGSADLLSLKELVKNYKKNNS